MSEEITLEQLSKRIDKLEAVLTMKFDFLNELVAIHSKVVFGQRELMRDAAKEICECLGKNTPAELRQSMEKAVESGLELPETLKEILNISDKDNAESSVHVIGMRGIGGIGNLSDMLNLLKRKLGTRDKQQPKEAKTETEQGEEKESPFDIKCAECGKVVNCIETDGDRCGSCKRWLCETCGKWREIVRDDEKIRVCGVCYSTTASK
jgi:hypothetical protein